MSDVTDQLTNAQAAITQAQTDLSSQAPSLADTVLAAVLPVLEAAGYALPVPPAPEAETPAEDAGETEEAPAA